MDKLYSEKTRERLRKFPVLLKMSRLFKYWISEIRGPMIFLDSERLSSLGRRMSLRHLEAQVKDPEMRKHLTPNFQFGCKRILVSDDYWLSFNRENVELVTDAIDTVTPEGIRTKEGTVHELDAIVLATGFALGLANAPFPIHGLGDVALDEVWKDGAVAYKGMAVSGFPNWFIMMGPNTGPGHTSVLVYTEAQIQHVLEAIEMIQSEHLKYVDVRQDRQDRYNQTIQGRMKHMVWSSGCNSWYLSSDSENHALYPGFAAEYVLRARHFDPADYRTVSV